MQLTWTFCTYLPADIMYIDTGEERLRALGYKQELKR
jgi:hypothetical protein